MNKIKNITTNQIACFIPFLYEQEKTKSKQNIVFDIFDIIDNIFWMDKDRINADAMNSTFSWLRKSISWLRKSINKNADVTFYDTIKTLASRTIERDRFSIDTSNPHHNQHSNIFRDNTFSLSRNDILLETISNIEKTFNHTNIHQDASINYCTNELFAIYNKELLYTYKKVGYFGECDEDLRIGKLYIQGNGFIAAQNSTDPKAIVIQNNLSHLMCRDVWLNVNKVQNAANNKYLQIINSKTINALNHPECLATDTPIWQIDAKKHTIKVKNANKMIIYILNMIKK